MSDNLLHQIQLESIDSSADLGSILRKCRLLAQRIQSEELKSWVTSELNGYDTSVAAPDYRIMSRPLVLGQYFGVLGAQLSNVVIPESAFPEEFREQLLPVHFHHGVNELQGLMSSAPDGKLFVTVSPEIYPFLVNESIREDFQLAQAKRLVPSSFILGILDTIRNRILNFTLELEEFSSSAGDPLVDLKKSRPREVKQTFNTHILGAVSNLNQGGSHVSQNVSIHRGDIKAVAAKLTELGFSNAEVNEFSEALQTESPDKDGIFGTKVSTLLGKAIQKAGAGALKIPTSVAGSLISELIKNYYGI